MPSLPRSPFAIALLLTALGGLPFLAGTGLALLFPRFAAPGTAAVIAYGAVILSFLGAVHWGALVGGAAPRPEAIKWAGRILTLGVLPSLVGWLALLVLLLGQAPRAALLLLALGFVATLLGEALGWRAGLIAGRYLALRCAISTLVVVLLLALWQGQPAV